MTSTAWRSASSKEGAFLIDSSSSRRTCSRRCADLRARSVFHGFSSSFPVGAILTSSRPPFMDRPSYTLFHFAEEAGPDAGRLLAFEVLDAADHCPRAI